MARFRTHRWFGYVGAIMIGALAMHAASQSTQPSQNQVRWMELPLQFPAVGNIEAVKEWRFGRLEGVDRFTQQEDLVLKIRTKNGQVLDIVAPRQPMLDLAVQSNWISNPDPRSIPGRREYVERMIAFDVDETGRLIAAASLEPLERNERRLSRATGRGLGR